MKNQTLSSLNIQAKFLIGVLLFILGISSLFVSSTSLLLLCIASAFIFSVFLMNRYYSNIENKSKNSNREIAIKEIRRKGASRYKIPVGVAYSSDSKLVTYLLLKAVDEHKFVLKNPATTVQFVDFGNSSLNFNLYFYSKESKSIEVIKNDLQYRIMELFRVHNIKVPPSQRDLWLRNSNTDLQSLSSLESV